MEEILNNIRIEINQKYYFKYYGNLWIIYRFESFMKKLKFLYFEDIIHN